MEQRTLKNVNNYLNTNIYTYLETFGGQSYNLYLNVVHFSTPEIFRHLWQLKNVAFLHQCQLLNVVHFSTSELFRHLWQLMTVIFLQD